MTTELIDYIKQAVRFRLVQASGSDEEIDFPTFDFAADDCEFSKFITENNFQIFETLILLLSMLPYIAPGFLTSILSEYFPDGSDFPEFGGVKGTQYRGIIPTGETAIFIVVGDNYRARNFIISIFNEDHPFYQKSILTLGNVPISEPKISGSLLLDIEYIELFVYGSVSKPKLSQDFPAQLLETEMEWDDLVLQESTLNEVNNVLVWMDHNETLLNDFDMKGKIKPGYKVMFFGAPGVGKTLTASLMGKHTGKDVYRIDLSLVISKYIGETEKNLSKLFNKAKNKDWILFFDIPERLRLWQKYIPDAFISDELDLATIAETHEVTGANIVNIVQFACLQVLSDGGTQLTNEIITNAIQREFIKEGRMV